MTTNITPIEALENKLENTQNDIKSILKNNESKTPAFQRGQMDIIERVLSEIQAFAPQECDTQLDDVISTINDWAGDIEGEFSVCDEDSQKIQEEQEKIINFIKELYNYKQLHSQQKTFTLEEIKEIIEYVLNSYIERIDPRMLNGIQELILQGFEKEVK